MTMRIFMFAATGALLLLGAGEPLSARERGGSVKCSNDPSGPRRSYRCNIYKTVVGKAWEASSSRARKLYIHKAAGDTGREELRWRIGRRGWRTVAIPPGFKGTIFLKKRQSTIPVTAEIRTVALNANGRSALYVHFETLDRPRPPEWGRCSNAFTDGGAQVCYSESF